MMTYKNRQYAKPQNPHDMLHHAHNVVCIGGSSVIIWWWSQCDNTVMVVGQPKSTTLTIVNLPEKISHSTALDRDPQGSRPTSQNMNVDCLNFKTMYQ